jgi:hypothetical protein
MITIELEGLRPLAEDEKTEISGGSTPLQYAMFFVACFKAGFYYGYTELGPALLGHR